MPSFGRSYGNIVRRCGLCDSRQPWLVWCTRSLPKRSQCRIPALGIGGSPDEAQGPTCGEVPIKHLSPRPCPGVCRCCSSCAASLSARSWSSYSLHIPPAPSHRRTFTGPASRRQSHVLHQVLRNSVKRRRRRRRTIPRPRATPHITEMKRVSHRAVHILALCLVAWVVFASGTTTPLPPPSPLHFFSFLRMAD